MSGTFKGFTENDLKKMKNEKESVDADDNRTDPAMKNKIMAAMKSKQKSQQRTTGAQQPLDEKAKLYKSPENSMAEKAKAVATAAEEPEEPPIVEEKSSNDDAAIIEIDDSEDTSAKRVIREIRQMTSIELEKPVNMQEFQLHQKLIEEQNRKRKEMLAKALEDRKKQTVEEAVRIEKIKKELETLDAQLHDDVSILRKQIDKSSLSFMEAEKQYHKVEMEYLAAKLHLQKERERKELLTEHLCTLIAHNESRKAKKLEALMDQLVYSTTHAPSSGVSDGVCEKTGKMLEMENGQYVVRDD